ncbi:MAG: hypothetical protein GF350_14845, partial [Chitinivibrionales bacterium]|nr:hypothetical protein [Chitinivibrionales bacterium]
MPKIPTNSKIWTCLVLWAVVAGLRAGNYTNDDFSSGASSVQVEANDSLVLAPKGLQTAKLYGDNIPANSIGTTRNPDVINAAPRKFSFFWADTSTDLTERENIYRREVTFYGPDTTEYDSVRIFRRAHYRTGNLHAAMGESNYLCVFVDHEMDTIRAANDNIEQTLYCEIGARPFGSMCSFDGDTFLVVHRKFNAALSLKKVISSSSEIRVADSISAASAPFTEALLNSAVAAEPQNKNILVVYTRRTSISQKRLDYALYSRSLTSLGSGIVTADVGVNEQDYYYEDAPVVAYGTNAFAAASWYNNTISLHRFDWDGTMTLNTQTVATGDSCRFPAVACNDSFLVVAWKGGLGSDNTSRIWGVRYRINSSGELATSAYDTIQFSGPSSDVPLEDQYGSALNVALDSTNAMAVTWPGENNVWNCIWNELDILYESGYWVSQSNTITMNPGDSVRMYPGSVDLDNEVSGRSEDSIRFARTPGDWGVWVPLNDEFALAANAGPWPYFQYKITLYRNSDDSLRTTIARQCDLSWNVKPSYLALDSVIAGQDTTTSIDFGDTLRCYSRLDPLTLYFRSRDPDETDSAYYSVTLTGMVSDTGAGIQSGTAAGVVQFSPLTVSDTFVYAVFSLEDSSGWAAAPETLTVNSRNSLPVLAVRAVWDSAQDGTIDTTDFTEDIMNFSVLEGDSIEFLYSVSDTNDPSISATVVLDGTTVDNAAADTDGRYVVLGDSSSEFGYQDIRFRASDPDTMIERRAMVGVNHIPLISSVLLEGNSVADGDTVRVIIDSAAHIDITVDDSDVVYWDTITFRFTTSRFDSSTRDSQFVFTPSRLDTSLRVIVTDIFGQSDTLACTFKYPWFSSDSADNPGLYASKDTLADDISLIVGGGARDTVAIPVANTGNDSMSITGISFSGSQTGWFRTGIPQAGETVAYDSLSFQSSFQTIALGPAVTETLYAWFDPSGLAGDGLVYDTVIIRTSDPVHPLDTIPVRLEYNDLPQIAQLLFDFEAGSPYWLAKKQSGPYRFPPHAKIAIEFSEPVDTGSAATAVSAYSIFDSAAAGTATPITLRRTWNNEYTQLFCEAVYTQPSVYFGNILPPAGSFLPTDSIALSISSAVTDRATTPSGPNALDVDMDYQRDVSEDTVIALKVDSITFRIISTAPAENDSAIGPDSAISVTFSGPVYAGTIDTSLENNRSLIVTSRYSRGEQLDFSSINIDGTVATFSLAPTLYFGDSVQCRYRSVTGRDSLGYPLETNQDGIPGTFIDSSDSSDDYLWSYTVREIHVASVSPDSGSRDAAIHSPITIFFDEKIYPGTIDADSLQDNRSFSAVTRYSSGEPIGFDSIKIAPDSMSIVFYPESVFFSVDSVYCSFRGFSKDFSYDSYS